MTSRHLYSIAPSHYCEKARWALQRAGVEFIETKHLPGFHILAVRKLGGGTSCPKLVVISEGGEKQVLNQSVDILKYADTYITEEADRLFPADEATCKVVEEWVKKFDDILGPHVRRWAYSYLLFDKSSYRILSDGISKTEKRAAWPLMPIVRRAVAQGIGMGKPNARERSLEEIQGVFGEVNAALADGRPFICGDRFTAADFTFAALGAPLVLAPGYGAWMPSIDKLPKGMADEVRKLQETAASKHIYRLYESERQRIVGPKMANMQQT